MLQRHSWSACAVTPAGDHPNRSAARLGCLAQVPDTDAMLGRLLSSEANLRDEPLCAHAMRPDKLWRVSVSTQRSCEGAGAIAGQHVQQRLWKKAAEERALPNRAARAYWGGSLEVLSKMCNLQASQSGGFLRNFHSPSLLYTR